MLLLFNDFAYNYHRDLYEEQRKEICKENLMP